MLNFSHDVPCCFAVCCTKLSLSAAIILLCAVMIVLSCCPFCCVQSHSMPGHALLLGSTGSAMAVPFAGWHHACLLCLESRHKKDHETVFLESHADG